MTEFLTPQFWVSVVEIIVVNILLSGDNAVVIALACRNLSESQRRKGIFWGVLGAVAIRVVLTFFAMSLLAYPYLKLVGAALLLWIGVKLVGEQGSDEQKIDASDRLLTAVWTIIIADLVMSLDNVMAVAAAADGNVSLLVFGLVISIPIVVLGSQVVMKLIQRFPVLVLGGGGLLGYIAGDLAVEDPAVAPWISVEAPHLAWIAPWMCVILVLLAGMLITKRHARGRSIL